MTATGRSARVTVVLGIESSCDETGVGLVRIGTGPSGAPELLGHALASSSDEHARFGGVVPEIASRAHLEAMTADRSRARSTPPGLDRPDVDAIAVTADPAWPGPCWSGWPRPRPMRLPGTCRCSG